MRAALVLMAALACCTPALAQKNPPPSGPAPSASPAAPAETAAPQTSVAVGLATTCLRFARGDADAVAQAEGEGWTIDNYGVPGSRLASMSGSRNISGVGDVTLVTRTSARYGPTAMASVSVLFAVSGSGVDELTVAVSGTEVPGVAPDDR